MLSTHGAPLSSGLLMTGRLALRMFRTVDRVLAIQELPKAYGDILRWRDEGESEEEIAGRLGIQASSVALLVRVAEAKLVPLLWADGFGPEYSTARGP